LPTTTTTSAPPSTIVTNKRSDPNAIANCNHTATYIPNADTIVIYGGVKYGCNSTRLFNISMYASTNRPHSTH
jgi:hypothetical protein